MKIVCIKDMSMEFSQTLEFTKGIIYEAVKGDDGYIHATNNSGNTDHGIGHKKDKFFKKHFVKIKGENETIELAADFEFQQEEELEGVWHKGTDEIELDKSVLESSYNSWENTKKAFKELTSSQQTEIFYIEDNSNGEHYMGFTMEDAKKMIAYFQEKIAYLEE